MVYCSTMLYCTVRESEEGTMQSPEKRQPVQHEQLSEERLAALLDVCQAPLPYDGREEPAVAVYATALHNSSYLVHDPYQPRHFSRSESAAIAHFAPLLYPGATPQEAEHLQKIDAVTFSKLRSYCWLMDDRLGNWDWEYRVEPYIHGNEQPPRDLEALVHPSQRSDAIIARLQHGAPREQLLVATAECMNGLNDPEMLLKMCERLQLSDDELRTCAQLYGMIHPDGSNVHAIALASERLSGTLFQGDYSHPHIARVVAEAFASEKEWQQYANIHPAELLQQLLPHERRRELTLANIRQHPRMPEDYLLPYIEADEVAGIVYEAIAKTLAIKPDDYHRMSKADIAEQNGLDKTPWQLQETDHLLYALCITATEGSELAQIAEQWQQMVNGIDPGLDELLYDCAVARNGVRPWPVEGWSGRPEEQEEIDRMLAEQKASHERYDKAKARLKDYLEDMSDERTDSRPIAFLP